MSLKKKIKKLIPALIGGVIGGLGGYFGASYLTTDQGNLIDILVFCVSVFLSYFVHIIIHEGGHWIFGILSGYQFVSFRIGSMILYKVNGTYKLGRYKLAGTGGQCLMSPPDLIDGMIPYRLYNMGGAIMNLLFVIPGVVVQCYFRFTGIQKVVCIVWIFVGLFATATNGIPMSMGEVDNDGKNAMSLGKNPKALYAFWLQLKVNQMQMEGKTLLEMPEEWFAMPEAEDMKNPMIAVIAALHCNRMLEEKQYAQTSKVINELLQSESGMLGVHRMLLQIDQIFCEIMSNRDENILACMKEKELHNFMKVMKHYPAVLRTQYAYALGIEHDFKRAKKIKKTFEKIMKSHPNAAELRTEKAFILELENTDFT